MDLRYLGVKISINGKGRCIDNIFVERLWRSLKYEEVYLHAEDIHDGTRPLISMSGQSRPYKGQNWPTLRCTAGGNVR